MSNEFRHTDVGTDLTKAEWEATDTHIANNQQANDMLYFNGTYWIRATPAQIMALLSGSAVTVVSGSLTAGAKHAKIFSWQNTAVSASILVHKILINITTGASAAAKLNVGQEATEIESDDLIDGAALDSVDVLNNYEDKGTNGSVAVLVADDEWITGFEDNSQASTGLVGKYYIFYTKV